MGDKATVMDALREIHEERCELRKLELEVNRLKADLFRLTTCTGYSFNGYTSQEINMTVVEVVEALLKHLNVQARRVEPMRVEPYVEILPREAK